LTLAQQRDGAAQAQRIVALETEIAKLHWKIAERRDRDKTYNLRTKADVIALLDGYPLEAALAARGLSGQADLVVRELDAMPKLAALYRDTPLAKWKEYMTFAYLSAHAELLPKALADADFDFFGRTLNGQPQQRDRWKRGVDEVNSALGEAVGAMYVMQHFPPEAKDRVLDLVENLRRAYAQRIDTLTWMTPQTKVVAREKLAAFRVKIGYPDHWRDYSALTIVRGDALGNSQRSNAFEFHRQMAKIGKPVDKSLWQMTPPTVNAYYDPLENNINFPAGILQPPFYSATADAALNFGGAGAVIGHELTHGFDDQGRQFDARGNLKDWWTPADAKSFEDRAQCFVDEYAGFTAVDEVKLNGKLTLGENTADNGGLRIALMAYLARNPSSALGAGPSSALDGFTPEQRVFLGWGQVWCENVRPERARMLAQINPHSPGHDRVNGVVSNMPEFQKAFACKADAPMVRKNQCRVW
jgi:predicted metalloendopeptidase